MLQTGLDRDTKKCNTRLTESQETRDGSWVYYIHNQVVYSFLFLPLSPPLLPQQPAGLNRQWHEERERLLQVIVLGINVIINSSPDLLEFLDKDMQKGVQSKE